MENNLNLRKALKLGALQLLQESRILEVKNISLKSDESENPNNEAVNTTANEASSLNKSLEK